MSEENWVELKDWAQNMYLKASENSSTPGARLIAHVWKDVHDKMWSIEQKKRVLK